MADYQTIVYEIQNLLALPEVAESEIPRVESLAREYSDAVKEVNSRLRECDQFLRKGNRDEAIRRCKADPNLLESVAALDFLELPQWGELLDHFRVTRPANMLSEIAEELNSAFSATQSLSELMRLHRLYALARRPLRERLLVMRKIAALDKDSVFWQEDIGTFEKARLDELPLDVDAAARSGDVKALAGLEKELRAEDWGNRPPPALLQRVVQLHSQLRAAAAHRELERLADRLNEAHMALDPIAGRKAREAFNNLARLGITSDSDPLLDLVAPAMAWLAQEDQREQEEAEYQTAVHALERGLGSRRATAVQLGQLYDAVARYEAGVPERLELRYQERLRQMKRDADRRHQLRMLAAVLVVAAVAGLTWYLVHQHMRAAEVARYAAGLESLIEQAKQTRNPEEAIKYVEGMTEVAPHVAVAPEIQELCGVLQSFVDEEEQRNNQRNRHLAAAKQSGIDRAAWESLPTAFQEIKEAAALAMTAAEKSEVAALERQVQEKQRQMQADADKEFARDWESLEQRIKNADLKDPAAIRQRIQEMVSLANRPHVSPSLLTPLRAARADLEAKETGEQRRLREEELLATITKAIGRVDLFVSALSAYREAFQEGTRSTDFHEVATQEAPIWKSLKRWEELALGWGSVNLVRLQPDQAAAMVADAEKLTQELADSGAPPPANVVWLLPYLKAVAQRVGEGGKKIETDLEERLRLPMMELLMVKTFDGKRYYFQQDPGSLRDRMFFTYFVDVALKGTDKLKIQRQGVANEPLGDGGFDWTSPQAKFSKFAQERLVDIAPEDWEKTFYAVLARLLEDGEIEPVLKVQLTQLLLDAGCKGSYCLQQAFRRHLEMLENARLDPNANWLDPDDEGGRKARRAAEAVLHRLPTLRESGKEAAGLLDGMRKWSAGAGCTWVGWLCKDAMGKWTCMTGPDKLPTTSGDLVVFAKAEQSAPAVETKIGSIREGKTDLNTAPGNGFKEGRPVFLIKTNAR